MIENKNRLIALIVLIAIAVGIIFYVVWGIILNKGTVEFKGSPPYTVSIGGIFAECILDVCSTSLQPRSYEYTIMKTGYYEQTGQIEIKRGETTSVNVFLEYIATIKEGEKFPEIVFPAGYAKFADRLLDISLFHEFEDGYSLKRLPKKIEYITFSPSGEKAIVVEKDAVSLYNTQGFSMIPLDGIDNTLEVAWSSDEKTIYTISLDEDAGKYALKRLNLGIWEGESSGSPEPESLVYFLRDIETYEISLSPDEKFVAIVDKTFKPETVYMINLGEESRTNIFEGYLLEAGKWAKDSSMFLFSGKQQNENIEKLWYWNDSFDEPIALPVNVSILNIDFRNGPNGNEALFVTNHSYNIAGSARPYIVLFNEEDDVGENWILAKWDIKENTFYFVQNFEGNPVKLEVNYDGSMVRILEDGMMYDIQIK